MRQVRRLYVQKGKNLGVVSKVLSVVITMDSVVQTTIVAVIGKHLFVENIKKVHVNVKTGTVVMDIIRSSIKILYVANH